MQETAMDHPMPYEPGEATYRPPAEWRAPRPDKDAVAEIQEAMARKFLVHSDRMVVWEELQEKTAGGIIIPDTVKDDHKTHRVWVTHVGPDAFAQGFRVGQCLRMVKHAGVVIQTRVGEKKGRLGVITADDVLLKDMED